jgi:excisionase family DNA binding protein
MDETSSTVAYTVAQTMMRLNLGRDSIYKAIRDGRLRARKFGKRTVITGADIERFLESLPTFESPNAA